MHTAFTLPDEQRYIRNSGVKVHYGIEPVPCVLDKAVSWQIIYGLSSSWEQNAPYMTVMNCQMQKATINNGMQLLPADNQQLIITLGHLLVAAKWVDQQRSISAVCLLSMPGTEWQ